MILITHIRSLLGVLIDSNRWLPYQLIVALSTHGCAVVRAPAAIFYITQLAGAHRLDCCRIAEPWSSFALMGSRQQRSLRARASRGGSIYQPD
jgi:hypothetical protein